MPTNVYNNHADLELDNVTSYIDASNSNQFILTLPDADEIISANIVADENGTHLIQLANTNGDFIRFTFVSSSYPDIINGESTNFSSYVDADNLLTYLQSHGYVNASAVGVPLSSPSSPAPSSTTIAWSDVIELDNDLSETAYEDALDYLAQTTGGQELLASLQEQYDEKIEINRGVVWGRVATADPEAEKITIGYNDDLYFFDKSTTVIDIVRASELRILYHELLHMENPDLSEQDVVTKTDEFLAANCSSATERASYDNSADWVDRVWYGIDENPMSCGSLEYSEVSPSDALASVPAYVPVNDDNKDKGTPSPSSII